MTKKLFWDDPYAKECSSIVAGISGKEVRLDRTVFFAFSGGQESDSGTIGGINVIEARKEGDDIVYVLEKEPTFKQGDEVEVKIDWEKRYKIMRLHSAAHIAFHIFSEKTGVKKLIGSNVTHEKARVDFEYHESVAPMLPEIEEKANNVFSQDIEIKTFPDEKKPGRMWWQSGDILYPCGGTHLKSTKEIGKVKLKRKNIGKGKERIEITLA